ncbi:4-coumarate--CoA ligase-like 5, partial [Blyttiomyces sp. JEL0837]
PERDANVLPRRDKVAYIDAPTGNTVTYGQLMNNVDRFVAGLYYNLGFKKWDVVGIYSPNHV